MRGSACRLFGIDSSVANGGSGSEADVQLHPALTGIGVTWLYGFQFEIKVIAKLPEQ